MTAWTKLAYGTIAATALLGAPSIYNGAHRSVVMAIDTAKLVDRVIECSAAAGVWPWTTNAALAGWGTGYQTNVAGAVRWSFMDFRLEGVPVVRLIPLIGGSVPARAVNESLRQIQALAPLYLRQASMDTNGYPLLQYHSVTSIWQSLQIGDGTSRWTVAVGTNGPIYGDTVATDMSTVTLWEAWRVLDVYTSTVRQVGWAGATDATAVATFLNATNAWLLEESWSTHPLPLDPLPPMLANFTAPGSALDYPLVKSNSTYNFSELGPFGTPMSSIYNLGGERCSYMTDLQAVYSRVVSYTNDFDDAQIHDRAVFKTTDEGTNKIALTRTEAIYSLAMPTFPSGVQARVTAYFKIAGHWNVNHPQWDPATNITFYGLSTNYPVSGVVTQAFDVLYEGELSTAVHTNIRIVVAPAITNWIPNELLYFEVAKHAVYPETWPYLGYPAGWKTYWFYSVPASATDSSQYPIITVNTPTVSGEVLHDGYAPLVIINWKFISRED